MTQLPEGFVLDNAPADLPEGFVLDTQPQQVSNVAAKQGQPVSTASQVGDLLLSVPTGLRAGAEALAGLPGDLQSLVETGFEAGRSLLVDETPEEKAKRLAIAESVAAPGIPGTEDIRGVTNQIVGEPRQPQTTAGEFARTIGEFVPAVAAGPGGLVRKGAVAATAGGASEAAGQLTEGTAAEPFARAAGGLAGGLVSAGSINRSAKKILKSAVPEADVKKVTDQLYSTLRQAGIKYNQTAYDKAAQDLAVSLRSQGFRAGTAPRAFSIVDELVENVGKQLDFDDLDSIRKAAGKVLVNPDGTERAVAKLVVEAIDDFALSAPIVNTAGKQTKDIRQLVLRARDFASRNIKQRIVNEAIEIGKTRQSGADSGIRNEIGKLLNGKKGRGFTKDERAALFEVSKGRKAIQTLSRFGFDFSKLGNVSTLVPGGAGGGLALAGEPILGGALVAAGSGAKIASRLQTQRAAEQAKKIIRLGKQGQARLSKAERSEQLKTTLRRLLVADPALQQSAPQ